MITTIIAYTIIITSLTINILIMLLKLPDIIVCVYTLITLTLLLLFIRSLIQTISFKIKEKEE